MPVGVRVDEFWPHSSGMQALEQIPPVLVKLGRHSPPHLHLYGRNTHLGRDPGTGVQGALGNMVAAAITVLSTQ